MPDQRAENMPTEDGGSAACFICVMERNIIAPVNHRHEFYDGRWHYVIEGAA